MCGRYTIRRVDMLIRANAMEAPAFEAFDEKRLTVDEKRLTFDEKRLMSSIGGDLENFTPRFNAAPTQSLPILRRARDGSTNDALTLSAARWGLRPSWAKDKKIGNSLINARSETVAEKPAFRSAFMKRRCLVPADGFYEWKRHRPEDSPADAKGAKETKTPHFIHLKSDEPFMFAGLWEFWPAEKLETFTILTTTPNELMTPLHDRMPVILTPDRAKRWLSPDASVHELHAMLMPFDSDLMDAYPVSRAVNSPRNESPDLIVPAKEADVA